MKATIQCQSLTKKYGEVTALDELTFAIEPNKIYGLLGRNGAGKTTLLHMINAQQFPTSGTITINGSPPYENESILNEICFIKESNNFNKNMKVIDALNVVSLFYPHWDQQFAQQLIDEFELNLLSKIKNLSKGMLSALGVTVGLASRAPITIFDEPYIGMDAAARQTFYNILLQDYYEHPRTIILSTHLIDEVSKLFEHVLILDRGQLLLFEDTDTLRQSAFYLSGKREQINDLVEGKKVINAEDFGQTKVVAIHGELSQEERQQLHRMDVSVEHIPLQKLMVYLTSSQRTKGRGSR